MDISDEITPAFRHMSTLFAYTEDINYPKYNNPVVQNLAI